MAVRTEIAIWAKPTMLASCGLRTWTRWEQTRVGKAGLPNGSRSWVSAMGSAGHGSEETEWKGSMGSSAAWPVRKVLVRELRRATGKLWTTSGWHSGQWAQTNRHGILEKEFACDQCRANAREPIEGNKCVSTPSRHPRFGTSQAQPSLSPTQGWRQGTMQEHTNHLTPHKAPGRSIEFTDQGCCEVTSSGYIL